MPKLISRGQIVEDDWQPADPESHPTGKGQVLSLDQWLARSDKAGCAVQLEPGQAPAPLFEQLGKMGLSFVFDGSVSAPSLSAISASAKLPYAAGYNLIDRQADRPSIDAELSRLSETAALGASPIGVGFAFPETIAAIKNWANSIHAQGLTLAPASHNLR